MTDPDRAHPTEPAEGADRQEPDRPDARTPHPEEPAEGARRGEGPADTPETG